jgi:hypothetical protein
MRCQCCRRRRWQRIKEMLLIDAALLLYEFLSW